MFEKLVFLGNHTDWWKYSLADFYKMDNVKCINEPYFGFNNKYLNIFLRISFSPKIGILRFLFQFLWFPFFVKKISTPPQENIILVIYDRNKLANNPYFLRYLKRHFKKIKLVYMFTNIIKFTGAFENNFVNKLTNYYDIIYAFDQSDAKKYSFKYSPLIYSKNEINDNSIKQRVFYVGKAKDRYDMLIKVFEKLLSFGLTTKYYIFGVPTQDQKHSNEIIYNKLIPYSEALKNIQQSDCLIDVIQGNSEGLTIKVCEAVFYNKLLITTNQSVKNCPFYNEKYIKIIKDENDITKDFFDCKEKVHYNNSGIEFFNANTYLTKLLNDIKQKEFSSL